MTTSAIISVLTISTAIILNIPTVAITTATAFAVEPVQVADRHPRAAPKQRRAAAAATAVRIPEAKP